VQFDKNCSSAFSEEEKLHSASPEDELFEYLRIFKDYFEAHSILAALILQGLFFSLRDYTKCRSPRKN